MRVGMQCARMLAVSLVVPWMAWASGQPAFELLDPGTEDIVDYAKYGEFRNVGTREYQYVIVDEAGLAAASGEGIDPSRSITRNPEYLKLREKGKLGTGNHWRRVNTSNPQLDYFTWNDANEEPGVRLLFVGRAMEKGGHLVHALKAYRAVMVLYPESTSWSSGGEFQWSAAEASWHAIMNLLRKHPELNMRLVNADVTTRVEKDNLVVSVSPGVLEYLPPPEVLAEVEPEDIEEEAEEEESPPPEEEVKPPVPFDRSVVIQQRGTGKVQLVQYLNGDWEMLVEGQPYFIRGMNYSPTKVGVLPWEWEWKWADENTNGVVDCFEVFVDANGNGAQDADEPTVPDFQLMKDIGANTIKVYLTSNNLPRLNHLVLRKMYHDHGIRVIVGNFLGAYCNDSGATWDPGTDYTSRKQRDTMKANVSNLVMRLKDEPWVLAWVLGNENNMEMSGDVNATRTNASKYPETFARFLNEVCRMIHDMDPNHPVGVGNLLTGLVEYYGEFAPALDYIGINSYISGDGFGATWQKIQQTMGRPVLITEFGCDSYWTKKGPDEETQADWILKNWEDIAHQRGGAGGVGNSIGGMVFEWLDEWWKDSLNYFEDPLDRQSVRGVFPMPFPDGYAQEEWFGIMGQGDGRASPFLRAPKKAYWELGKVWNQELEEERKEAVQGEAKEAEEHLDESENNSNEDVEDVETTDGRE